MLDIVTSISNLRGIAGTSTTSIAECLGCYTAGDGGGGLFYWDGSSSASDNNGTIIKPTSTVGAGRWLRLIEDHLNVRWFGAKGDGITDDIAAIQATIDTVAGSNLGSKCVLFPAGKYLITSPINLNSSATLNRSYIKLRGESHPPLDGSRSSAIVGQTGAGKAIVEAIGSNTISYEDLTFVASDTDGSTVGIFQARATGADGFGGRHFYENVTITVFSSNTSNNNIGGIGIIILEGEETVFENIEVWSALNIAHVNENLVSPCNVDSSGIPQTTSRSFTYVPVHTDATPITTPVSNTVYTYSGECRLISSQNISPNVLISSAADIDFGHTFMQRGNGTLGKYDFNFDVTNLFKARWSGTAENSRSMIVLRGAMEFVDFSVTQGNSNLSSTTASIIYYIVPTVATRDVRNCSINLRAADPAQKFLTSVNASGTSAHILRVTNCVLSSDLTYAKDSVSPLFLYRCQDVDLSFSNGVKITYGRNIIGTRVAVTLGRYVSGAAAVKVLRVYLPVISAGHQSFTSSVLFYGNIFTGGAADSGLPSVVPFEGAVNIANQKASFLIKTSNFVRLIGSNLDYLSAANSLSALALSTTVNNTDGYVDIFAKATGTGDGIDNVILTADVKVSHSLGDNSAPALEPEFTYGNALY